MKQLIIILSIVLCVTNGFSQTNKILASYKVDFFQLLELSRDISEEEFLRELDKYFRESGIHKGYSAWQLHGYDFTTGTFVLAEFFMPSQTPILVKEKQKILYVHYT